MDDFNLEAARATQLFWDLIYGKYSSYILDADEDKIAVKAFVTIAGLQLVSYPSEVTAYSKFVQDFVNQARGILDVKIPQIGTGGKGKRRRKLQRRRRRMKIARERRRTLARKLIQR